LNITNILAIKLQGFTQAQLQNTNVSSLLKIIFLQISFTLTVNFAAEIRARFEHPVHWYW